MPLFAGGLAGLIYLTHGMTLVGIPYDFVLCQVVFFFLSGIIVIYFCKKLA